MSSPSDHDLIPPAPDFQHEYSFWSEGIRYVAGIDEAGRGALAGPVVAAVFMFPSSTYHRQTLYKGVRDSKQMTPTQRETWCLRLKHDAFAWGIGLASHQEIDALGILQATRLAAHRALETITTRPQQLLIDYIHLPDWHLPQVALVKGDQRSLSIAAASIIAKVARDALLCELDDEYPGYGFSRHKGYCTAFHRIALEEIGPCPIHRRSFMPVQLAAARLQGRGR